MPFLSKIRLNGQLFDIRSTPTGSEVTGVKGENESQYRHGNVNITKENIGLGNVGNYKAVSTSANQGLSDTEKENARNNINAIGTSQKGAVGGVAELDLAGKVPANQLPSFVDDVLEFDSVNHFPATGESGKIYIAKDTEKTYRWSGSRYVVISETISLGETNTTAYRGDRGKQAYDHATDSNRLTTAKSTGLYKISTTNQGHIAGVSNVQKGDITALGIPGQDTTYSSKAAVQGGTEVSLVTTGEKYLWNQGGSASKTDTIPSAYCETSSASAAKVATCTGFTLKNNSYLLINMRYGNTSKSAITLNISGQGAKNVAINGSATSASNYSLPAGTYIVRYRSPWFYFRTDDIIPGTTKLSVSGTKLVVSEYW